MANWTKLFRSMAQVQLKNRVEDRKLASYLATVERNRNAVSMSHYKDMLVEKEFAAKCRREADHLARRGGLTKRRKTKTGVKQITLRSAGRTHGGTADSAATGAELQKLEKVRRRLGEQTRQARGIGSRAPRIRRRGAKMNLHNHPPLSLPPIPEGRTTFVTEGNLAVPGDQQSETTSFPADNAAVSSGDETRLPLIGPSDAIAGRKREVRLQYSHRRSFSKISSLLLSPIDETKVSEERTRATANLPPSHRDSPTPTKSERTHTGLGEEVADSDYATATSLPPINLANRATGDVGLKDDTSLPETTTTTQSFGSTIVSVTVETMRAIDIPVYTRTASHEFNLPPLVIPDYRKFALSDTRAHRLPEARLQPKRSSWADFWIGDPNAIGSVRRARVAPEQLSQRSWAKSVKFKRILMADEERFQASRRQLPKVAVSLPQLR